MCVRLRRGILSHESPALSAAKRLEPLDLTVAPETYLEAFIAATTADRLTTGGDALEVVKAVRAGPSPPEPLGPVDQLLDGLAVFVTDGPAAAKAGLHQPLDGHGHGGVRSPR